VGGKAMKVSGKSWLSWVQKKFKQITNKLKDRKAMAITIVPQLPVLKITAPGETVCKTTSLADGVVLEIEKQMIDGEFTICELLIENISTESVDFIDVLLVEKKNRSHSPVIPVNESELENAIYVDKHRISSFLPLHPLKSLTIPITIFASLFS